ncbi:MAG: hypothetical protein ACREFD_01000 [Stellaceae bacterium]
MSITIPSTPTNRRSWARRATFASVLALSAALAVSTVSVSPASAYDHHHGWHRHWHHAYAHHYWHNRGRGYYGAPGGYYYSPGYYYNPPPVVYGPGAGVVVNTPGFSFGFGVP